MGWIKWVVLGWAGVALLAGAGAIDELLQKSGSLLRSGAPDEALRLCREARVEYPESAPLLFAIGSAEAAMAEQLLKQQEHARAGALWRKARETFGRTAPNDRGRLGAAAAYNGATCLLRLDASFDPATEYDARLDNLGVAIGEFETYLSEHPDDIRAQKNLDFARYTLNLLRQNPPKEQTPEDGPEPEDAGAAPTVNTATTEIPGATAEVVDGSTVILQLPTPEVGAP